MAKSHSIAEQPLEEESYFVSMTDMMVGLLFIFILMLMYFALQYQKTTEQLTNANKTRGEILVKIGESLKNQGFEVEINPESGILRLNEKVLRFSSGSAVVEYQYHDVIAALANALGDVLPCYSNEQTYNEKSCTENEEKHWLEAVFIEGHTDNVPYPGGNLMLSTQRAGNTYAELTKVRSEIESLKNGENQPLLSVSGYGEKRPVLESKANDTSQHRQMNRRIELRIIMATPQHENINQPVIESIKEKIE
ncbi:MAG: OmpA family protein [Micavibrio sp.]|nr:OmpA family protein [Micavibrio sp.]MBK9561905.1 OmpA family protein [Micavibrio sp.]